jgi:hypothetical protein
MSEFFLIDTNLLNIEGGRLLSVQSQRNVTLTFMELLKESRGDGELVTATELLDLVDVSEGGTHDDSFGLVDGVIVEDFGHREDSWVFCGVVVSFVIFFFVPVENAAHKGRNEEELATSTGNSLGKVEDKGHVALDFALEEDLGCLDALPGGGDLDKDSAGVCSRLLVESEDALGPFYGFSFVETERGINLS